MYLVRQMKFLRLIKMLWADETGLQKSNLLWMDDGGEVVLGKNVDKDLL